MRLYLVMLGPPGAGKGTQAQRLCKALGLYRLATGDLFRQIARETHPLAERVRTIMEAGRLVDDTTVFEVVCHYLTEAVGTSASGVVLDGYPRTLPQAEQLDRYVQTRGEADALWCVYLDLPEGVAVERLAGRRICPRCERIYHLRHVPPDGRCEVCGTPLVQRADDTEEVIRQRFQVYREQTEPLVDYYRGQGRLVRVDADRPEEAVFACIAGYVRRWLVRAGA